MGSQTSIASEFSSFQTSSLAKIKRLKRRKSRGKLQVKELKIQNIVCHYLTL
jgi:hypothetical protein